MVMWMNCVKCNSPVDEFENKCHSCGDKEAVRLLKESNDEINNRNSGQRICGDGTPRRNEARI